MPPSMRDSNQSQRQTPRTKHRRSAKGSTCTNCRQQKLKCDSANLQPEPCSRCQQTGQRCVIDPSFRRRGNREYTRSLEQELQTLRGGPPSNDSSRAEHSADPMSLSDTSPSGVSPRVEHVSGQKLDSVTLPPHTVLHLIEHYFTNYHPNFPILPDLDLFILEYDSNRLLLWTVLAIASRGLDDHPTLFSALVDPVRKLAAEIYGPQSRSLRTMQALILLCVWPFPFQQTHNDPSPLYGSLATHIGYSLGLHRPLFKADFEEIETAPTTSSLVERKTWYGCFIVNQSLAMRLGIPPTLSPGNAILSAVSRPDRSDIPKPFLLELEISMMSHYWLKVFGDDETSPSGECKTPEVFIQTFENQCTSLQEKYDGVWCNRSQMHLNTLKLQVYSFVIGKQNPMENSITDTNAIFDVTFAKAQSTVVRLISNVSEAEGSRGYWPVFAKYHVMFTACVSIYMAAISTDATAKSTLLETCKVAISSLAGWSMFSKDSFSRIGKHIATAARRVESYGPSGLLMDDETLKGPISARMAANIPYRIVWNAKHGKSPEPEREARERVQSGQNIANYQPIAPGAELVDAQNVTQPLDMLFGGLEDMSFIDGMNDVDFTDMLLDWSTIGGPIQGWSL